jgi:hypothetical protein
VQHFEPLTVISHSGRGDAPVGIDFDAAAVEDWWIRPSPGTSER